MSNPAPVSEIPEYALRCLIRTPRGEKPPPTFSASIAASVWRFHRQLPGYAPTNLVRLRQLARSWGLADIMVKDESTRFGLKAFKVLGGSYAVARMVCDKLGTSIEATDYSHLISQKVCRRLGRLTLATATDGNHGRGVAWAAEQFKQPAVVFMPRGSAQARVASIRSHGASVEVTDLNYDDTVRLACQRALENGWQLIQDTALPGYTAIPRWIMQGYLTMAAEAAEQMTDAGLRPTHVFLQAGVGAFAGAMTGYLANRYPDNPPRIIIIEPENAACILKSAAATDGRPRTVRGNLETIMAGLACGEPSLAAWEILRDFASGFISCADQAAANGMRALAYPLPGDPAVEAGESGAVGLGVLDLLMNHSRLAYLKSDLTLDHDATLLFFNTEGATDPANYRHILQPER